jgi:hypothetical protein
MLKRWPRIRSDHPHRRRLDPCKPPVLFTEKYPRLVDDRCALLRGERSLQAVQERADITPHLGGRAITRWGRFGPGPAGASATIKRNNLRNHAP